MSLWTNSFLKNTLSFFPTRPESLSVNSSILLIHKTFPEPSNPFVQLQIFAHSKHLHLIHHRWKPSQHCNLLAPCSMQWLSRSSVPICPSLSKFNIFLNVPISLWFYIDVMEPHSCQISCTPIARLWSRTFFSIMRDSSRWTWVYQFFWCLVVMIVWRRSLVEFVCRVLKTMVSIWRLSWIDLLPQWISATSFVFTHRGIKDIADSTIAEWSIVITWNHCCGKETWLLIAVPLRLRGSQV